MYDVFRRWCKHVEDDVYAGGTPWHHCVLYKCPDQGEGT